ncbi:MAG: phosphatase [Chloroflexi bacterium]|nr:MAG: phosphatase [Chloroflexota bacterium]
MIRFLIWDAGGTLFDTYPAVTRAFEQGLADLGAAMPAGDIMALARQSTQHAINTLARETGVAPRRLAETFRCRYDAIPPEVQPPFPGVRALCAFICERGGQNFIVTHRGRASLMGLLRAHQMESYFSDILTKEDPFPRKPDPAAIEALIRRHDLDRDATLLIGDRDLDILAAHAAGIRTCFFGAGEHTAPADIEITAYAELHAWIVRENGF